VTFCDIDANSLILWKVSLPCDQSLKKNVEQLNLLQEDASSAILSDIFPDELKGGTTVFT
jgi:hypothetical protein